MFPREIPIVAVEGGELRHGAEVLDEFYALLKKGGLKITGSVKSLSDHDVLAALKALPLFDEVADMTQVQYQSEVMELFGLTEDQLVETTTFKGIRQEQRENKPMSTMWWVAGAIAVVFVLTNK